MPRKLRRFTVPQLPSSGTVCLSEGDAHHILHVLRLKHGDRCVLADSEGREATATISSVSVDGRVELTFEAIFASETNFTPIIIAQAMPQRGIMDSLVEKAGELNVRELILMETSRTQVHPRGLARDRVLERWKRIAHETAKQSGNPEVKVASPNSYSTVLARAASEGMVFIAHTRAQTSIFEIISDFQKNGNVNKPIFVFVGPEGGFSDQEIDEAVSLSAKVFSLPGGTLKTETAFVAIVSLFRYFSNDRWTQR